MPDGRLSDFGGACRGLSVLLGIWGRDFLLTCLNWYLASFMIFYFFTKNIWKEIVSI
jgi:hypothetical protein